MIVFIASAAVLAQWTARMAEADEVVALGDAGEVDLLAAITRRQPRVVVLEEGFACTDRGAALLGQLRTDPALQSLDIRLLSSTRLAEMNPDDPAASLAALAQPIPTVYPTERRAVRRRVSGDVAIEINATRGTLVDISTRGAQVLSPVVLRAEQRVTLVLAGTLRLKARVVWVALEVTPSLHYRAGLEFLDADRQNLEARGSS